MSGKRKKTIVIYILALFCFVAGGATYFFEKPPQNSCRYYLENSGGAVVFEHEAHKNLTESCAECHHTLLTVSEMTNCKDCHDDDFVAEDFEHEELTEIEAHQCTYCHQTNEEIQPQSCRFCHPKVQEKSPSVVICADCHDESYTKSLLSHDEMQEIEEHSCADCHNVQSLSDSYHRQCTNCHLKENETRFSEADGRAKCSVCHLK